MRIAMWSGPRNLSTAMMYSFAARGDCAVWDEPFYAAYLDATELDHPMRDQIIAAGETDPARVMSRCTGPAPDGSAHFYQKHMCHHMIDGFDRSWINGLVNVFLIRHPARVLASYAAKRENPTLHDIGFAAQIDLFHQVRATGASAPIVIDSATIRAAPEASLRLLCDKIGLNFAPAMLSWPKGGHPADGAWAPHWYGAVWNSTGFAGPEGDLPAVDTSQAATFAQAMQIYEELSEHAIAP